MLNPINSDSSAYIHVDKESPVVREKKGSSEEQDTPPDVSPQDVFIKKRTDSRRNRRSSKPDIMKIMLIANQQSKKDPKSDQNFLNLVPSTVHQKISIKNEKLIAQSEMIKPTIKLKKSSINTSKEEDSAQSVNPAFKYRNKSVANHKIFLKKKKDNITIIDD